jgi:succinyl-CoA synthetase alpha subunit
MIVRATETVLVHGISGKQGAFWTERMRAYGTRIVGGVHPEMTESAQAGLPIWESVKHAAAAQPIDVSALFVPPWGMKAAALDAIAAGVPKLVLVTGEVPVQDLLHILAAADDAGCQVLGPHTAGVVTPGECFVGVMPAFNERLFRPGRIGVIARSGSLGMLICLTLVRAGRGISSFIAIGGAPIVGTTIREALAVLEQDPRTAAVVVAGEIGGRLEEDAADYVRTMAKPVVAYIAGAAAPIGRRMGHAGAIVVGQCGSCAAKAKALAAAGAAVVAMPSEVPAALPAA